jgi:hypothetical protein
MATYKDLDMTSNPEAGRMLNEIRWELHTKLGDVLDNALVKTAAYPTGTPKRPQKDPGVVARMIHDERVAIMDWIFDVFDRHCGIEVQGEDDT